MMFLVDIAFVLEVAVFGFGLYLFHLAKKEDSKYLKNTGWFIIILVGLIGLCTTYYGVTYWNKGYFQHPNRRSMMMNEMGQGMGPGMMMDGTYMQGPTMGNLHACTSQLQGKVMDPSMVEQMKSCMAGGQMRGDEKHTEFNGQ